MALQTFNNRFAKTAKDDKENLEVAETNNEVRIDIPIYYNREIIRQTLIIAINSTLEKMGAGINPSIKNRSNIDAQTLNIRSNCINHIKTLSFDTNFHSIMNPSTLTSLIKGLSANDSQVLSMIMILSSTFYANMPFVSLAEKNLLIRRTVDDYYVDCNNVNSIIPEEIAVEITPTTKESVIEFMVSNSFIIPLMLISLHLSIFDLEALK